jgi:hypothetical protein
MHDQPLNLYGFNGFLFFWLTNMDFFVVSPSLSQLGRKWDRATCARFECFYMSEKCTFRIT